MTYVNLRSSASLGLRTQPCLLLFLLLLLKKNILIVLSNTLYLLSFTPNKSRYSLNENFRSPASKKKFQKGPFNMFVQQMTKTLSSSLTLGSRVYLEWVQHVNAIFHCSYLTQLSENKHLYFKGCRISVVNGNSNTFPRNSGLAFQC